MWHAKRLVDEQHANLPGTTRRLPVLEMAASSIAFVVWAIALPDSPITAWQAYDRSHSAAAVIVGGIVLAVIAPPVHPVGRGKQSQGPPRVPGPPTHTDLARSNPRPPRCRSPARARRTGREATKASSNDSWRHT
jgi:hypothetical protein